jgi:hypothetical protein
VLIFTCASSELLMQTEEERLEDAEDVLEVEDVNDEGRPGDAADDKGPPTPCDGNDVVPDTAEGHQGTVNGDQDREV